jgi:MYXO-CTERM domain-containing protein
MLTYARSGAAALVSVFAALALPGQVRAQNIVSNPDFANGLLGFSGASVQAATYQGMTAAFISQQSGYIQRYPLATTPGVNYMFTFLAAAVSSQVSFTADLGPTTQGAGYASLFAPAGLSSVFTRYTITGTVTSDQTYAFVQTDSPGGLYITDFDVEPAPAPTIGGGALSLFAMAGGLAIRRRRDRVKS